MKPEAVIWTEGKTDQQHLGRAFDKLGINGRYIFGGIDQISGDDQLLKQCIALSRVPQETTIYTRNATTAFGAMRLRWATSKWLLKNSRLARHWFLPIAAFKT